MLKNALLLLVTLLLVGCSAERRDVVRYFETMQPYFTQFTDVQNRLKLISAVPFPERAAAYRALAQEASGIADKVAAVKAPSAAAAYHQQYTNLWRDFVTFVNVLGDVVDQSNPKAKRDEAGKQMEQMQAAWPGKLNAAVETQKQLGKAYGIDFQ